MTEIYGLATLWLGLALLATLLSIWLRIATAMSEIIVGTVAQLIIGFGPAVSRYCRLMFSA
jgi:glutathione-regulated potassium-efflux system ancillary protein KefC